MLCRKYSIRDGTSEEGGVFALSTSSVREGSGTLEACVTIVGRPKVILTSLHVAHGQMDMASIWTRYGNTGLSPARPCHSPAPLKETRIRERKGRCLHIKNNTAVPDSPPYLRLDWRSSGAIGLGVKPGTLGKSTCNTDAAPAPARKWGALEK